MHQVQLIVILVSALVAFGDAVKLRVKFDKDAILDSRIIFNAWLESPERDTYDIEWNENYPKASKKRFLLGTLDKGNNFQSNFTLPYLQKDDYNPGRYTVTVTVSYVIVFYFVTVDTKILHYTITPTFQGEMQVNQPGVPKQNPTFMSTKQAAEFVVDVHDTAKFLETATSVNYTWIKNNTIIANTTVPRLNTSAISQEGIWRIQANLTAVFTYNSTNVTIEGNSTTGGNSTTLVKNGTFELLVNAKVPIQNFAYTGATWFRHGKLLDLKINCDGTPPYTYCWQIIYGPYNRTGNETCVQPTVTNECEFRIKRYFIDTGLYSLLILMNNDVSKFVNQSSINVYKATHKPQLSIIVVPITCSIIAIVLVIFGVAYYWENHMRYTVEVADFDFGDSTGVTQVTIVDRIRDTIYTWTSRRAGDTLLQSPDEENFHNR